MNASPPDIMKWDGRRFRGMRPNARLVHFTERQLQFITDTRIKHGLRSDDEAIRVMIEVAGMLDR